jgi:dethiobiotin synthetase
MNGLFITATDTGAGKTVITAALLMALLNRGINSIAMKPIQTGAPDRMSAPDVDFILNAAKLKVSDELYSLLVPYALKMPASPHLAAKEEKTRINTMKICSCFETLKNSYKTVLVEGTGGLLVPITQKYFILDLIKEMKLPAILVARAGLGTLNHTLLSCMALEKAKIPVCGIVLNMAEGGQIEKDNFKTLKKLIGCKIVKIDFFKNSLALKNNLGTIGKKLLKQLNTPVAQLDRAADS